MKEGNERRKGRRLNGELMTGAERGATRTGEEMKRKQSGRVTEMRTGDGRRIEERKLEKRR